MNILAKFGLMKRSEHEAIAKANKGLLRDILAERAKFKTAVIDLAAQSDELEALRPDALLWRNARARRAGKAVKS